MSEVKRWEIETPKVGGRSHLLGPDTTHSEAFTYTPVREDRATETDIEAVTKRIFLRRYPELEWVEGGGRSVAAQAECRRDARELLSLVFGEGAEND